MQCPVDGETLVMADRSGVEIDYCPKCRGVWLDRGELDKIISRGDAPAPAPARRDEVRLQEPPRETYREEYRGDHRGGEGRRYRDDDDDDDRRYPRRRRESFLSDLFDF
jgi:Zn-finger nucleic acid-binding protein